MAKSRLPEGKLLLARERIYPAAVRRHVLAVLSELNAFAASGSGARPASRDDALCPIAPHEWLAETLTRRFLATPPQRRHMHQWVEAGVMHYLGAAAVRLTDYRPIVVPFLFNQALSRGMGYLTRAGTSPEELSLVAAAAHAEVEAAPTDCVFSAVLAPPLPEYWESENWPKFVTLVEVAWEQ